MKKKLLSLVLAGAMVASTSVSAFAETISGEKYEASNGASYNVTDKKDANIKIEGSIADDDDRLPPSTISVTVPTVAKFTVDSKGKLIGSNISITSQGNGEIEVIAEKFVDRTSTSDINAVDKNTLDDENNKAEDSGTTFNRKMVYLKLIGEDGSVSLQSGNGVCDLDGTTPVTNRVLGTVRNEKSLELSLEGNAVTKGTALTEALSDSFTLTLKLRKKA